MALKLCIECKSEKEASSDFFSKNSRYPDKLQPRCIPCHKRYAKQIRDNAPKNAPANDPSVMKKCCKCGESKSATVKNFHRHGKMPDGLQKRCILCALAWSRDYYNNYPTPPSRTAENLTKVSRDRRANPELKASDSARTKERYVELRSRVLAHYSEGKMCCACCGISTYKFLSLDHVDGGGNRHRKNVAKHSGFEYLYWFVNNGFPTGFQVLCHNCNSAKGFHGTCPHKDPTDPAYIA